MSDETPWTEEQWEEFMKHADVRAARYSELMETLMEHPDRDDIIDKEMGWDRDGDDADPQWLEELAEAEESQEEDEDGDAEDDDLIESEFVEEEQESETHSALDEMEERDRSLRSIPAYSLALSIGVRLMKAIAPAKDDDPDEELVQAMLQANIAAAKIAGGHAMGYQDEVLGGNVVNCKRALAAANECRVALCAIAERQLLPAEVVTPLARDNEQLIPLLEQRIAELRARMWWQQR